MADRGILKAFGEAVRQARHALRLTQEQLAFESGLNRNYVADIEKGRRRPSLLTVFALAKGLSMPASALVARAERLAR